VVDSEGRSVAWMKGGYLAVRRPWPGMVRRFTGDQPSQELLVIHITAGADVGRWYFAGDGARRDADGLLLGWPRRRRDQRSGTAGSMEIESAPW